MEIQPAHWETTWPNHSTRCLEHGEDELDQLALSDVLLPPQIRSDGRDGREPVIRVHQHVDEAVKRGAEIRVSTRHPVHDEPPDVEHAGVVIHVQERDLVVILPQDEEERVHKLNEFGEVIPPEDVTHPGVGRSCTVCVLAEEVVSALIH